jgi:hypothetical protein
MIHFNLYAFQFLGNRKGFPARVHLVPLIVHFLPRGRKRNQKKTPVSRLTLRVVAATGARGNSLSLRQSAHFFPFAAPMLGAGQWDYKTKNLKTVFRPPSKEVTASRATKGASTS